jgi:hypothetical protein
MRSACDVLGGMCSRFEAIALFMEKAAYEMKKIDDSKSCASIGAANFWSDRRFGLVSLKRFTQGGSRLLSDKVKSSGIRWQDQGIP